MNRNSGCNPVRGKGIYRLNPFTVLNFSLFPCCGRRARKGEVYVHELPLKPKLEYLRKQAIQKGCKTDLLMAAALGNYELVREHLSAMPVAST